MKMWFWQESVNRIESEESTAANAPNGFITNKPLIKMLSAQQKPMCCL